MKHMLAAVALAACAPMGAAPHHATVGVPADSGSAALGYLESLPTMDGGALPPRADAPRTVVLFFASW